MRKDKRSSKVISSTNEAMVNIFKENGVRFLPNEQDNPVNRSSFNVDGETYWKERAEAEIQRRRASNIGSQTVH